jgi:hypothetical protein
MNMNRRGFLGLLGASGVITLAGRILPFGGSHWPVEDDTATLQRMLDEAPQGQAIVLSPRTYHVRTLFLHDENYIVGNGATLRGITGYDGPILDMNGARDCFITGLAITNTKIGIQGLSILNCVGS